MINKNTVWLTCFYLFVCFKIILISDEAEDSITEEKYALKKLRIEKDKDLEGKVLVFICSTWNTEQ